MGMIQRDDMGLEVGGDSGLGACIHLWWIHVNVWQNQYSIVKQNKVKKKKKYNVVWVYAQKWDCWIMWKV